MPSLRSRKRSVFKGRLNLQLSKFKEKSSRFYSGAFLIYKNILRFKLRGYFVVNYDVFALSGVKLSLTISLPPTVLYAFTVTV